HVRNSLTLSMEKLTSCHPTGPQSQIRATARRWGQDTAYIRSYGQTNRFTVQTCENPTFLEVGVFQFPLKILLYLDNQRLMQALVAGARNLRYLRLIERQIPKLAAQHNI